MQPPLELFLVRVQPAHEAEAEARRLADDACHVPAAVHGQALAAPLAADEVHEVRHLRRHPEHGVARRVHRDVAAAEELVHLDQAVAARREDDSRHFGVHGIHAHTRVRFCHGSATPKKRCPRAGGRRGRAGASGGWGGRRRGLRRAGAEAGGAGAGRLTSDGTW